LSPLEKQTSQNSAGRRRIKEEYSFKDMVQIAGGF
jgi:hypothetical protein